MLTGALDHVGWVAGALTMMITAVAKAWFRLRSREVHERSKNYRMRIALKGCEPHERAEIIRALDGDRDDPPEKGAEKRPEAKE